MITQTNDYSINTDDISFGFSLSNSDVRGQIVRLGPATADEIISRHGYDEIISEILGEALGLATLAGSALKFDGRLIVELRAEHGRKDVPLEFIIAEYSTSNSLRGMAKIRHDIYNKLLAKKSKPNLKDLFGDGILVVTIDQGAGMDNYQGQVGFVGDNLSQIAENYFLQSEQIQTKLLLAAIKENSPTSHKTWRAHAIMIQKTASDAKRADNQDVWDEAVFKFKTLKPDELLDETIGAGEILYRLYHENDPVINQTPKLLIAKCSCNRDRLVSLISNFADAEIDELLENDGQIHAHCEFCNSVYRIKPDELRK